MQEQHYLIPTQEEGQEKDITHSILTKTIADAEDWFVDAKERLLDVNNWKKFSGIADASFKLTDSHGRAVNRRARKGDHIRIDIPEQGVDMDGGFYWAVIEAIEYDDYPDEDAETFAIRVRPSSNPMRRDDISDIFGNVATSTFVIGRAGKILNSGYHGRNEQGDLELVSITGYTSTASLVTSAWLGLSDAQCAELVIGFME